MYNVLITDDEQIVIDSLTFIIDRNFPGQVTVFPARSGSAAIQIVRSNHIDIVFMDINMPGINGLESVEQIRHINPNAVIIILSAFDRFQYAQEAINLGAYKYLTKPVNRNLITQTIRNAIQLIDDTRNKIEDDIEIHEKLNFISSIVESDFIYSAVLSGEKNNDLSSYLEYFKISEQTWFFACVELPAVLGQPRYDAYMQVRDILTSFCQCIIGSCILNRIIVFFPYKTHGSAESDNVYVHDLMNSIYMQLSLRIASGIKVGIGVSESDITKTVPAYNTALSILNNVSEKGGILFYSDDADNSTAAVNTSDDIAGIIARLQSGDITGMTVCLSELFSKLYQCSTDADMIKSVSFELLITARNYVRTIQPSYQNKSIDAAFSFLSQNTKRSDIELFVTHRLTECISVVIESTAQQKHPTIMKSYEYISAHISSPQDSGDITLEQTAQYLHVTPVYLSRLFKEQTGCNFIDYVTQLRLEKAKEMMQNESLSIKEISHNVGYNDQNYFSKLFRKKFGITPTEYRGALYTRRQKSYD